MEQVNDRSGDYLMRTQPDGTRLGLRFRPATLHEIQHEPCAVANGRAYVRDGEEPVRLANGVGRDEPYDWVHLRVRSPTVWNASTGELDQAGVDSLLALWHDGIGTDRSDPALRVHHVACDVSKTRRTPNMHGDEVRDITVDVACDGVTVRFVTWETDPTDIPTGASVVLAVQLSGSASDRMDQPDIAILGLGDPAIAVTQAARDAFALAVLGPVETPDAEHRPYALLAGATDGTPSIAVAADAFDAETRSAIDGTRAALAEAVAAEIGLGSKATGLALAALIDSRPDLMRLELGANPGAPGFPRTETATAVLATTRGEVSVTMEVARGRHAARLGSGMRGLASAIASASNRLLADMRVTESDGCIRARSGRIKGMATAVTVTEWQDGDWLGLELAFERHRDLDQGDERGSAADTVPVPVPQAWDGQPRNRVRDGLALG